MASHSSDVRALKRQLEREGFDVLPTGTGHWKVSQQGRRVTIFANSPSDRHWRANTLSRVKQWKRENKLALRGNKPASGSR